MSHQITRQSISEFIAELKKPSHFCEFVGALKDFLRDLLLVGVADDRIRRRLLAERTLKFTTVKDIAIAMESTAKNVADISTTLSSYSLAQTNTTIYHVEHPNHSDRK